MARSLRQLLALLSFFLLSFNVSLATQTTTTTTVTTNPVQVQATTVTTEDWATFTAGVTLGATIELGSNVSDQCVSSVATVLESAYLVGYYLSAYLVAESDEYVTYAAAYMLKMV
jgi:DhnA family fructose-bisphosphate aldolase class Ia